MNWISIIISALNLAIITASNLQPIENKAFTNSSRQGKFWSWWTWGVGVVRFQNGVCRTSNNLEGTCYTRRQCSTVGGYAAGKCARNIAVCCISQFSCGDTSSNNNTYFVNPGFPNTYSGSSRCVMTIERCNPGICQVRIDFLNLILTQPNGDGVCTRDSLMIVGGATQIPVICGENTGQHVYVDFAGNNSIQLIVDTSSAAPLARSWSFKVSQIECSSPSRAPSGCLMYLTSNSGTVQSFNYGITASNEMTAAGTVGTRQLANTNYGICVKPNPGFCCIQWSQSAANSFFLSGNVDAGLVAGSDCTSDYVVVPNSNFAGNVDRFCGSTFSTVRSCSQPFVLTTVTNGNDSLPNDGVANRGFALSYTQQRCTNNLT